METNKLDGEQVKLTMMPKQSGHWYTQDGQQVTEVMKRDCSGYTKPTIVHARKHNLGPGVTSIIRVLDQPALNVWKQGQAIMAGATCPRQDDEDDKSWLRRVNHDMNEHANAAANEGTKIHAALEAHYRGDFYDLAYNEHVAGVVRLLTYHCESQNWLPEKGMTNSLGYGTKADLHCGTWLIDFKGKDGDQGVMDTQRIYEGHRLQLAATRACLPLNQEQRSKVRCAIVFVSRSHPGACSFLEVNPESLNESMNLFEATLKVWQLRNKHKPQWTPSEDVK